MDPGDRSVSISGVNGDDILFKANSAFDCKSLKSVTVNTIGFTLSTGKTYISSSFIAVNSWVDLRPAVLRKLMASCDFLLRGISASVSTNPPGGFTGITRHAFIPQTLQKAVAGETKSEGLMSTMGFLTAVSCLPRPMV